MDAILLALVAAALFGAMPVAVRQAFAHPLPVAVATLLMQMAALVVIAAAMLVQGGVTLAGTLPFVLAGAIAPGLSQLFVIAGIRDAGSSRASVAFGMAPLFAIVIAVSALGEDPDPGVLAGALLIVGGGLALAGEKDRPPHVRRIGIAYALVGGLLFAVRDNLVRHLSLETEVPSLTACAVTMASALVVTALFVSLRHLPARVPRTVAARWVWPGVLAGLSYVALFEAFYRGRVTVVAPIIGTESLWGVAFSALLIGHLERVGARLVLGAVLVVVGGVAVAVFR